MIILSGPARYSDMMLDIEKLMEDPARAPFIKKETLCETLAGNDVPILTVTSSDPVFDIRNKKFVIVTSRVHPGESPSSWIMRGILHYITGRDGRGENIIRINPAVICKETQRSQWL